MQKRADSRFPDHRQNAHCRSRAQANHAFAAIGQTIFAAFPPLGFKSCSSLAKSIEREISDLWQSCCKRFWHAKQKYRQERLKSLPLMPAFAVFRLWIHRTLDWPKEAKPNFTEILEWPKTDQVYVNLIFFILSTPNRDCQSWKPKMTAY